MAPTTTLRRLLALLPVLALSLCATMAAACPDVDQDGQDIFYDSDDLWTPHSFDVVAGGEEDLDYCDFGFSASGHVAGPPDFELHYTRTANHNLRFTAEGNCDTVLLINTGAGNWFYDDDGSGEADSEIELIAPSEGIYDIWIGTFSSGNCNAELQIETFPASD